MKWYGEQYSRALSRQLRANCLRAAEIIADKAKDLVDTPYPPASRPGEHPHRRTGTLQQHIRPEQGDASDIDEELAAIVISDANSVDASTPPKEDEFRNSAGGETHYIKGAWPKQAPNFPYAAHLELMGMRPYLTPALDQSHDAVMECMRQSDLLDGVLGGVE